MNEELASPQPSAKSIPVQSLSVSAPVAVSPFDMTQRFEEIRNAIERRAFELFLDNGASDGFDVDHWTQAEAELLHPVQLSVVESDGALNAKAELPGFSASELQISLEPRRLTISGKRDSVNDQTGGQTVYHERSSSEIFRAIDLPVEVDATKATATLKNGVLELVMPKVAEAKATDVQAKSASAGS